MENKSYGFQFAAEDKKAPINTIVLVVHQVAESEREALLSLRQKFASFIFQINEMIEKLPDVKNDSLKDKKQP